MGMLIILLLWAAVNACGWLVWAFWRDDTLFDVIAISSVYNAFMLFIWAFIKASLYLALFMC